MTKSSLTFIIININMQNNTKAKTKAFNISLDINAVEEAKANIKDISFSKYLSDLITKDNNERNQIKTFSDIFGKDFKQIPFTSPEDEQTFYSQIGLNDYEIKTKN